MSSVIVPIAVASSYGLDPASTVEFVQRTLFVLGIAGMLQTAFGHRLPVLEAPAGLWWGVFALYAGLGSMLFGSHTETLRVFQFAFLLSGIIFILLSVIGVIEKLARLFTPTVVGVYLILMVIQLSAPFLSGMFGLHSEQHVVDTKVFLLSVVIVTVSYVFMKLPGVGHYTVLFSLTFGWILFYFFDLAKPIIQVNELVKLPEFFAFGSPRMEVNMVIMVIFITLLLLANMLATVSVVQKVMERRQVPIDKDRLKQAGFVAGINQSLGGIFSAIGAVPVSSSGGFIETTNITERKPFFIGSSIIILISLFPTITAFFAAIPEAVGYAALFPIFASTISLALREFSSVEDKTILYRVAGISLFAGTGVMFIPAEAFSEMSPTLVSVVSNGLVLGGILAVVTERLLTRKTRTSR